MAIHHPFSTSNFFSYNIPVCGINLGELGFLNQIEVHQLQSHIKRIAQGDN